MPGFGRSHSARPRVSDYVVETETDFELFQGQIREVTHAGPLHGEQISQVNFVLTAYVAPGHGVDLFLLTRQDADNNFASDISIRRDDIDPDTDDRYLEELAFEIKSTLVPEELEQRARIMAHCGVRRVFAVPVTGHPAGIDGVAGPLAEWMPAQERWRTYRDDEVITDPCLFEPVPVRALLDAVEADNAVAQALLDKGNPVLVRHAEAAREKGRKEGEENAAREYIHLIMHTRGLAMDAAAHARVDACRDLEILYRWLVRAVQVTSASDLFGDD
jgi:hypothetical protein